MQVDEQPSNECECGGYIGWTEHPDYWDGSCYGQCAGYPTRPKGVDTHTSGGV